MKPNVIQHWPAEQSATMQTYYGTTRIVKQVEPEKEKIVEVTKIYETKKGHYVLDPTLINNTWKWCEKNKKPATNNNIH